MILDYLICGAASFRKVSDRFMMGVGLMTLADLIRVCFLFPMPAACIQCHDGFEQSSDLIVVTRPFCRLQEVSRCGRRCARRSCDLWYKTIRVDFPLAPCMLRSVAF